MQNKKTATLFLLVLLLFLSLLILFGSGDPPKRFEMDSKYQHLSNKKLQEKKDWGEVLTPKVKATMAKDLVGQTFSFNDKRVLNDKIINDRGEFFLKFKKDGTFLMINNYAFKYRNLYEEDIDAEDTNPGAMWIFVDEGTYTLSKDRVDLYIEDSLSISRTNDQKNPKNIKRINDFKSTYKNITVEQNTLAKLPPEIKPKIDPDKIKDRYPKKVQYYKHYHVSSFPDEINKKFRETGDYIIKKNKENNWDIFWPGMEERNRKNGDRYYVISNSKMGYLCKYDHVYPIPESIPDFLNNKIKKGELTD